MNLFPHEVSIAGVYAPPEFIAAFFGLILALITSKYLNKYRISNKLFYPPLVMVSLVVIYTILMGVFIPF